MHALKVSIIVVSSIPNQPIIRIYPRDVAIAIPVFVAFCQYGAGHYDADIIESAKVDKAIQPGMCRCGSNDKTSTGSERHRCTQSNHRNIHLAVLVFVPTKHVVCEM